MLTNRIRVVLIGRVVLTVLIHLGGSQRLEGNRSLNRLGHIIIDGDGDSLSAISALRGELVTLSLTKNGLAVLLGNQLGIQNVFLTRNQTLVRNLVHNLGTSNNLTQATLEVSVSGNLRSVLLVVTRGTRLVRLGRFRRLGRLIRGRRLAVRRLVRLRGLGSFRGRGLYRLGLRRLTGLRLRRFLRLGRLLTLRVTRLLRLAGLASRRGRGILRGRRRRGFTLATVTRLIRNLLGRGGGLRSGGLGRLVRLYSLSLIVDIGVLGDVILLTSGGILAVLVNSSGGQVLESNSFFNSLGNTLINGDLNLYLALRSRWYEGLLAVADYRVVTSGLVLDLGTQLCIQSVFLARN